MRGCKLRLFAFVAGSVVGMCRWFHHKQDLQKTVEQAHIVTVEPKLGLLSCLMSGGEQALEKVHCIESAVPSGLI